MTEKDLGQIIPDILATATVDNKVGKPAVNVTVEQINEVNRLERKFNFEFVNMKGEKGDTPVKGVDYLTEEEKQQFTTETLSLVTTEGAKQVKAVTDKASEQISKVSSQGNDQISLVSAEGQKVVEQVKKLIGVNPAGGDAVSVGGKTRVEFEKDTQALAGKYNGNFPLTSAVKDAVYLVPTTGKFYICNESYSGKSLSEPNENFEELSVFKIREKLGNLKGDLKNDLENIYGSQVKSEKFPVKTNDLTERFKDNYYLEVTGNTLNEVSNDGLGLSSAKSSDISNCQEVIIANVWGTVSNILGFVDDGNRYIKETQAQPFYNFEILDKEKKIIKVKVPKGAKYLYYNVYTKDKASAYCNGISYTGTKKLEWLELDSNGFEDESINPLKLSSDLLYDKKMSYEFITGGYPIQDGYTINTNSHSDIGTVKLINVKYNEKYKIKFAVKISESVYRSYFVFGKQDNIAAIDSKEISNYVKVIDDVNHIYEITIPKNCTFFLSAKNSKQLLEITKIETKKELNWLSLKTENFEDNTIPESAIIKKIVKEKIKYKYTDSLNKPFEFKGKTCVAFGDSITSGISSPNLKVTTPYIKLFADKVGLTIDNRAVSGTCITGNTEQYSIQNRILSYKNSKDYIFIAGGTNDFNSSKELGKYGDSQPTTFYGSLKIICEYITTTFPSSTVIFITPIPYTAASKFHDVPNELGYELNDYRNAIYEIATLYKFNVIDGTKLGMPEGKGDWSNAMCDDTDGCHPSAAGHELYARNLTGKLC